MTQNSLCAPTQLTEEDSWRIFHVLMDKAKDLRGVAKVYVGQSLMHGGVKLPTTVEALLAEADKLESLSEIFVGTPLTDPRENRIEP
jgi:hypothetical protein